jgi:hypothetical protein
MQFILLAAFLIPAVLFLLTQQNTLKAVKPENRFMNPGSVWLQMIPIVGQIWQFFVILRISASIQKEMASRQDDSILGFANASAVEELRKRPTFAIGIAYCTLITITIIINATEFSNLASELLKFARQWSALGSLAGMICWIIYWVRLAQYKKKLLLRR